MNCATVSKLPDGSQWLFEIKLDGYRYRDLWILKAALDENLMATQQQMEKVA